MFGALPFYRSYNPYLHSSYHQPFPNYNQRSVNEDRARALADRRAKRAQWLPDEDDDYDDDDFEYNQLSPQERAYVNAHQNQAIMERERQRAKEEAEARKRVLEEQRWQQELDRHQREDQEMRRKFEQERERRRQQQQHTHLRGRSRSHEPSQRQQSQRSPSTHTSIPISDSTVANGGIPSPKPASPGREPQQQKPATQKQEPRQPTPPPQYGEEHVNAASKLQHHFRVRQSLRLIKSLASQFNTLRNEFTYPSTISFQNLASPPISNDVINVAAITPPPLDSQSAAPKDAEGDDSMNVDSDSNIPKLAFNSINYSLHAYMDSLDKLLVKLDGVESWGDRDIRARRRAVVKRIEREQARLDRFWKDSWLNYVETQKERKEQEVSADGDMPMQAEASS